jgi:hypothetical protein
MELTGKIFKGTGNRLSISGNFATPFGALLLPQVRTGADPFFVGGVAKQAATFTVLDYGAAQR